MEGWQEWVRIRAWNSSSDWIEDLGSGLARARLGVLADLRLDHIMTLDQAEAVQSAAVEAYSGTPAGYSIQGTTALSRRQIFCDEPIFGPLLNSDVVRSGSRFRLPRGVVGAGCSFVFAVGRPYPADGEPIKPRLDFRCNGRLPCCDREILGRRVPGSAPLNALTATADFCLSVLNVEGPRIHDLTAVDLAGTPVAAKINGSTVGAGRGADAMTHPLEAAVWLARELKKRGRKLEAGDLIATGSCVGFLRALAGQVFEADFGPIGSVNVSFD